MSVRLSDREVFQRLENFEAKNSREHAQLLNTIESYKEKSMKTSANYSKLLYSVLGIGALTMATLGFLVSHLLN